MRKYLEQISISDNVKRRNFIIEKLTELNCPYFIQYEKMGEIWVQNIIVKIKRSSPKIVLAAHYDTFKNSSGANDNASGVCILLKFIENYINSFPNIPEASLEFVFFDHEETGLLGSKAYLNRVNESDILTMINIDTCGIGDTILLSPKKNLDGSTLGSVVSLVSKSDKYNVKILDKLPPSDEQSFDQKGIPSILVFTINNDEIECMINAVNNPSNNLEECYPSVIETIHNGPRDSIDFIQIDTMEMTLNWLNDIIKNFT